MPRRNLFALCALLTVVLALSCTRSKAAWDLSPTDGTNAFTWIAVADHEDEPVEGLVDRLVAIRPVFVVGVGDIVFESKPESFKTLKKVMLDPLADVGVRYYPVAGNHDFPVQPHWFEFWAPPANKLYYSFDYGNSHFVILDVNRAYLSEGQKREDAKYEPGSEESAIQTQSQSFQPGSAQYEWLRKDLAGTNKKHIFVFFHEPAFSYGGHDGSPAIQKVLCPLLEQYKVTAAFSGHSHGYERFVPLRVDLSSGNPVAVRDDQNGVVYVVAAGGYRSLYDITPNPNHAVAVKAHNFARVDVRGDTARVTVIEPETGKVLDSFELKSRRH
jgi:hypothetical protein